MNKYIDKTLKQYLDDLSTNLPAPGGGSASACVSSLGVSLFLMVCNFTIGKEKYKDQEEEIKKVKFDLELTNKELQKLIDEDVIAYSEYSEIKKLPENNSNEKKNKIEQLEKSIQKSTNIPLDIMTLSISALKHSETLKQKGNKNLTCDIYCGEKFLIAGYEGGRFNVNINLPYIKNADFKNHILSQVNILNNDFNNLIRK